MQPRDGHRYFVLVCGLFETVTVTGAHLYVLAVIEHAKAAKNLVMDLEDAGSRARFLIRDRDGKFPGLFDALLKEAGIEIVLSGVQMPTMNALMERWVQTCRRELLNRTSRGQRHPRRPRRGRRRGARPQRRRPVRAMTPVTVTAKTASGTLRGRIEDGVTVFRGVRYAVCERFAAPRPVPAWDGNGTPWPTTAPPAAWPWNA